MAARATMMFPRIEDLLDKVDSKFTLVTLASQRGRQINSYFNQLGEGLGAIVPPQVASVSRKPLSIALEEVAASKITYHRNAPVEIDPETGLPIEAASDDAAGDLTGDAAAAGDAESGGEPPESA
jgi:DNA-directed RNA polymerase subunit omega